MRHLRIFLALPLLAILASSCTPPPRERARKAVKEYIEACRNNDTKKKNELEHRNLYAIDPNDDIKLEGVETTLKTREITKDFITKDSQFEITGLYDTDMDIPSEVLSKFAKAYKIKALVDDRELDFTMVAEKENGDFLIYDIEGLYEPDLIKMGKELNCSLNLNQNITQDKYKKLAVRHMLQNLEYFDTFANAVAANDTAKMVRLYNILGDEDVRFNFDGKPIVKKVIQNDSDKETHIVCTNNTTFRMKNGMIVDSYGIIDLSKAEAEVKALGETPKERNRLWDLKYVKVLEDQARQLKYQKELEQRSAKYRAQGVALVSSEFCKNGKGAKGVEFSALNTSNKSAKYIIMEVVGYNAVDDPVWSDGYLKTCRGIGPVPAGSGGTWSFDDIWERGDLVDSYEIKRLIIQFEDGTSKSVKLPQPIPSNWREWL